MDRNEHILRVENLKKHFNVGRSLLKKNNQIVKAIDGIDLSIRKGEVYGLVGESGCGKSTAGRTIMGLYEATEGKVIFNGKEIQNLSKNEKLEYKKKIQMIFQDPYASLDPRMTIADIIGEPYDIHKIAGGKEKEDQIVKLMNEVGLKKNHLNRYPHEFSGGQRQRIGIARALALDPELVICDEPISALDVSIQAQIVNLLQRLQKEKGLTYIFIAHDLSMIRYICDRISVMYLGQIAETCESTELFNNPYHPYTKALMSAIPIASADPTKRKSRIMLEGDVPSPINPPSGCRFRTRCSECLEICSQEKPRLIEVAKDHFVACHLYDKS